MSHFDSSYDGNPPWDIGKPQQVFINLVAHNEIKGPVIDVGCGTGENSLYFAKNGIFTTGIDLSAKAIYKANLKARERNISNVKFSVQDLFKLKPKTGQFNTIIDSGVFHIFDYEGQLNYQFVLKKMLKPEGKLFIIAFNDKEPPGFGPPGRISKKDFNEIFNDGWVIEDIIEAKFEHNFSDGYAKAYLAKIKKD